MIHPIKIQTRSIGAVLEDKTKDAQELDCVFFEYCNTLFVRKYNQWLMFCSGNLSVNTVLILAKNFERYDFNYEVLESTLEDLGLLDEVDSTYLDSMKENFKLLEQIK